MAAKTGVLLLNLGTPDEPKAPAVRRYLRQFLSDPRVLDIPAAARWLLLNAVILPFRPKRSAEAYAAIWEERGSPLMFHTQDLAEALARELGHGFQVRFAMRYQNPSLASALAAFRDEGVERIVVAPLYPQYASSSTGSSLEALYKTCATYWNTPALTVIPPFYNHPAYLESVAAIARESMGDPAQYDFTLMSFHGLPERHVKKSDVSGSHCLASADCCETIESANRYCYRAQCVATAKALAELLHIPGDRSQVCFQSRLGRTPWIRPYTDEVIEDLPRQGVKKLAILVPSFTADCLETLEEIAIRGKESFLRAGGESLHMVPALNAHPVWVKNLATILNERL